MGAWLGVGGCYEVDCTSPALHSTKSTKSTKSNNAPVQQSGTKAPVGATLKFKVAGFRGVDRKQRFPVIAEGKISGFFWQFANPDEKQNSRDSFDLCGNSSVYDQPSL